MWECPASQSSLGSCVTNGLHGADVDRIVNIVLAVVGDIFGVLDVTVTVELKNILRFTYALPIVLAFIHIDVNCEQGFSWLL